MWLVWVVISLVLIGIVGIQESFARGDSPRYSIILTDIEGNVSMPPSLGEKNFLRFDSLGFSNQEMPLEATISIVCGLNEMVLYDETKLLTITSSEVIIDSFTSKFSGDYTITMMAEGIQPISIMFSIQGSIEDRCDSEFIKNLPPMKQIKHGVKLNEIICKENMQLIFKSSDSSPACVKPDTAEKLIERGWINDESLSYGENVNSFEITDENEIVSEVQIKISDERIITHSSNIITDSTSSLSGMSWGCPTNWPTYTIDTPSQVIIGEEFDIIVDYSYAIPDLDAGYEDPDEIFEPEKYHESCLRSEILIRTPSFVKIIDQRYINEAYQERWDTSPPTLRNEGVMPYEFDNTGPQQEIITMRIDQPRFGDQISEIYISPGLTIGATRIIATHDGIGELIETDTELASWSVDDYSKYETTLAEVRSLFSIPAPIQIHNQTWIDQIKPDLGYNPQPPQGNPPDIDEYASWLLQLPFPNEMRYTQIMSSGFPQYFLDDLFAKYPELKSLMVP